jgi:hypothetical protein
MKKILFFVSLALFTLLSACTSGSSPTNPNDPKNPTPGTVNKVGIVALATVSGVPGYELWSGVGSFVKAAGTPVNPYEPIDRCVAATIPSASTPGSPTTPTEDPVYLDAGDALTFRMNGSTYAVFPKKVDDKGVLGYQPTTTFAAPTSTVSLDIPGASNGFPAFSNVTMPAVASDFSFTPSNGVITAETRFTWTGSSPGAMVLFGNGKNAAGDSVFIFCSLKDDGEYVFPADVRTQLAGLANGKLGAAYRINSRIETRGDASLILLVYNTKVFF